MRARTVLPVLLLGAATLAACAGAAGPREPAEEPYVVGPVESVTHHATASRLLVRAGPGSREPCGISATVDAETRFLRRRSSAGLDTATLEEVRVGEVVEVYVEGPVAESCPVQGYAATIVIRGG